MGRSSHSAVMFVSQIETIYYYRPTFKFGFTPVFCDITEFGSDGGFLLSLYSNELFFSAVVLEQE